MWWSSRFMKWARAAQPRHGWGAQHRHDLSWPNSFQRRSIQTMDHIASARYWSVATGLKRFKLEYNHDVWKRGHKENQINMRYCQHSARSHCCLYGSYISIMIGFSIWEWSHNQIKKSAWYTTSLLSDIRSAPKLITLGGGNPICGADSTRNNSSTSPSLRNSHTSKNSRFSKK